jgi:hypothetical protein
MGELDRYLDYLETFENFIPDVIVNDYVEKMRMPGGEKGELRDRINQAYIDHKRIADERNVVVITASQIKIGAVEKRNVSQASAASDDSRKLGNIDIGFTFTQTPAQYLENRMQIYMLVNRSDKMYFGCSISTNREIGQLCLGCWPLRNEDE